MSRNIVRFQKSLSEPAFEYQYGTEDQCQAAVIQLRRPNGFECPACGGKQSIDSKHVPRYLAEFEYRFIRRYDLAAMLPRLCWANVPTTRMPYRLFELAEVHAQSRRILRVPRCLAIRAKLSHI